MDHRKNFVKAMKAVSQLDNLLARMDQVFNEYHQIVLSKARAEITSEEFLHKVGQLGNKRKGIFKQYEEIVKIIDHIKNEYGGEIKE